MDQNHFIFIFYTYAIFEKVVQLKYLIITMSLAYLRVFSFLFLRLDWKTIQIYAYYIVTCNVILYILSHFFKKSPRYANDFAID